MIYFLYGQDSYRSKEKLEEIILGYKKVHKSGFNLIYIDAVEKTFFDLHGNVKTKSMFDEKKLIVLKSLFSAQGWQDDFLKNIEELENSKDIIVVYEDKEADKRTKIFKLLQKKAKCQEFSILQGAMLKKWVAQKFSENNSKIEPQAIDTLVNFAGGDLWRMAKEIEKLSAYKNKSIVFKKDVELMVKPNEDNDIFKTIDALSSKNKKLALSLLQKHINGGESPLYLLSMISYQFRNLLVIKELQNTGIPYGLMAKKSGLHPFVVQKNYYLCNQFSMDELKKIYRDIFQVDSDIKVGKIEPEMALELLLSKL